MAVITQRMRQRLHRLVGIGLDPLRRPEARLEGEAQLVLGQIERRAQQPLWRLFGGSDTVDIDTYRPGVLVDIDRATLSDVDSTSTVHITSAS